MEMKKMEILKKISLVFLVLILCFVVTGCSDDSNENSDVTGTTTVQEKIVSDDFNEEGTGTLNCVTDAVAGDGIDVDIRFNIEYKNGNILLLRSVQKVTSNDDKSLDLYENSFNSIANSYKGLKYYDTTVIRDSNTVIYDASINYEKIDTDKLLVIEGSEDNVIVNGKAKLSLWLKLAEKVGTVCEEA